MEFIKTMVEKHKANTQRNKECEITSTFSVQEKDNSLWILHNGYAIKQIPPTTTAEEIVIMLNEFKETAIKFE